MDVANRDYKEIEAQLQLLRHALFPYKEKPLVDLFDEFMAQREYELALHTVCDFLLGPAAPLASEAVLQQIRALHSVMGIEDGCADEVQKRKLE